LEPLPEERRISDPSGGLQGVEWDDAPIEPHSLEERLVPGVAAILSAPLLELPSPPVEGQEVEGRVAERPVTPVQDSADSAAVRIPKDVVVAEVSVAQHGTEAIGGGG
jgi:hypothetical protein